MSDQSINYDAVLADIEARIAQLQATATGIRAIIAMGGGVPSGPSGKIAHDAFLKMSIPEATKKYLTTVRQKKDTQAIIDALEQGGLPRSEYQSVYSVLRRREKQVGDIINMQGDWALAEWYPNHKKKTNAEMAEEDSDEATETGHPIPGANKGEAAKSA
ncbi:MAG TPA: hypothetical protein VIY69_11060 [Candidatus Acidoferrales bacterium]